MRFEIDDQGRVTSPSVQADGFEDPDVGPCIQGTLRGWQLPSAPKGETIPVTWVFDIEVR
jgi:hypothetical protein